MPRRRPSVDVDEVIREFQEEEKRDRSPLKRGQTQNVKNFQLDLQ